MPTATAEKYLHEYTEGVAWAKSQPALVALTKRNLSKDMEALDTIVTEYLNKLFLEGEETSIARLVLHGAVFKNGLPKTRTTLPRARRALAGFLRDSPETSKDPCPEEACALICDNLLRMDASTKGGDLLALLAAAAMTLQLDLGGRPSETLELTREHVIEPQGRKHPNYGARFHPLVFKKASKSQQYDDTVFSRVDGDRAFYGKVLPVLRGATRPGERLLSPLTYPSYNAKVAAAEEAAGLKALHTTPHAFRHTMASMAMARREMSLTALMSRLRVKQLSTVRHYAKPGVLQHRLKTMGAKQRRAGETLLNDMDLNPFARMLPMLRILRERRSL